MAHVEVTANAFADLDRLYDFIATTDPELATRQIDSILRALPMLAEHPLLGRPAEQNQRELVLSRGRSGYVVKYHYAAAADIVFVLAIRHQREAGYSDEPQP